VKESSLQIETHMKQKSKHWPWNDCEDWTQDWLVYTRNLNRCRRITWPNIQNLVPHENVWWTCKNVRTSNTAAFWKMTTTGFTTSHKGTFFGFAT